MATNIVENIGNRLLQIGQNISHRALVFAIHLPSKVVTTMKRLLAPIFNIYVLFWCLKHLQKKLLDPLLDFSIGMSTLNGWKTEQALRYQSHQSVATTNDNTAAKNTSEKNTALSGSEPTVNLICVHSILEGQNFILFIEYSSKLGDIYKAKTYFSV